MKRIKNWNIGMHCILACLYFLLLPTTTAVDSGGNSFLKLATIPIAAYFCFTILFSKRKMIFNVVHLLLCIYTLSTLITLFISFDSTSISSVIGYFLNAGVYLCLTVIPYNEYELTILEYTQVLLLLILVCMTLFSDGEVYDRTTLIIFGQESDPNYFVGYFIFPISVTLKKIVQSRYRLLYAVLLFLGIYCVFLTGSRGGLLAVILTVAAFALIYPANGFGKFFLLLGGCGFILLVWFLVLPFLPENIVSRMTLESVIQTGGTGRWDIWKIMLTEIKHAQQDFIIGRGFGEMSKIFLEGRWDLAVAHNQLIQVMYNQGIIGLITFLALTLGCFFRCVGKRRTVSVAIIGMMALSVSLSFNQTTRTFWNLVAYAAFNFTEGETNRLPEVDQP